MASFNHTRGDSPRTPCAQCARESGWTRDPSNPSDDVLMCPRCKTLVSPSWLDVASTVGTEHVCARPVENPGSVNATDLCAKPGTAESFGTTTRFTCWTGEKVLVGKAPMAAALSDADLRAECERRWGLRHMAEFIEYDGDVMTAAVAMGAAPPQSPEAAAFRARMDDPVPRSKYAAHRELEIAHTHLVFDIEKAKTERDEWKRRAEAAEAESARRKTVVDAKNELLYGIGVAKFDHLPFMSRVLEQGPGIGPKRMGFAPDNSIAHLDEDLLADDA